MMKSRLAGILAGAVLASVAAVADSAMAQGMQWTTGGYDDRGSFTSYLSYGVPESDDVQFSATCSLRKDRGTAPAVLGYDTGNLREGARVNVRFLANGQQVYQKPGRVFGTRAEHGVSGVRFRPSFHDFFWQVLSRGGTLTYQIGNRPPATINLNGAASPIRQFTENCKSLTQTTAQQPPVQRPPVVGGGGTSTSPVRPPAIRQPDRRSCNEFGRLKSFNSNQPLTLVFTNRSGSYRGVLWLDYQGRPIDYAGLNPGQTHRQQTFVGHPWMFTNGPGDCKEIYVPRAGDSRFDITVR